MARRLTAAVVAAALAVLAGACGEIGDFRDESREGRWERPPPEETTTTDPDEPAGLDLEGIPEADRDDAIIEVALEEVERYWADTFPEVYGEELVPVTGGFHPYGPNRELPRCAGFVSYPEIAGNAFYCPSDDLIAWDTDNLTNDLLDAFGPFTLVIVAAHEYGHAIQARVPVSGPTIAFEQQADCFAGAFTGFLAAGGGDVLSVTVDDLDGAVAGFISLRDALGTPSTDPRAHGSAFDRVGAFQDGFDHGAARCAEYEDIYARGGTTVIDLPLSSGQQLDAPLDPDADGNIFDITLASLEAFWSEALPARFGEEWTPLTGDGRVVLFDPDDPATLPPCADDVGDDDLSDGAVTCFGDPDDDGDDVVAFDAGLLVDQYNRIGDFAVSGIISREYSRVAQARIGAGGEGRRASLQADCFSGAWAGEVTNETIAGTGTIAISFGDLDEAVLSFLLLGENDEGDEVQGSPFERVASFREGFFGGLRVCGR